MSTDHRLAAPWRVAALDLCIKVEAMPVGVLVHGFGRVSGTLCALIGDHDTERQLNLEAERRGALPSLLSENYLKYDRELFVATLNDWGWFGRESPPAWFTGEPWSP